LPFRRGEIQSTPDYAMRSDKHPPRVVISTVAAMV
jgi:hypothetical protein